MEVDPAQNPTSPFYLHPSNNPGQKLVNFKFNGNSYADWKCSMLISLSAKNKLGFVDGSLIKPAVTSDTCLSWESTAREIWLNLEERYCQSSGALLYYLQQALHEIKQDHDNISGFYTKIKMMWDQLDVIDPIPMCSCINCNCNITQRLLKSQQDRRLVEFLMKLNDSFEVVRGSILMFSPLPNISHAYRLLVQEENHKQLYQTHATSNESMAFAVNNRKYYEQDKNRQSYHNYGNNDQRRVNYYCDHCKIPGHSIQSCYKLKGYTQSKYLDKGKRVAANAEFIDHEEKEN
ncbi:uncharacterized protein LOC110734146 [Chenopodium quinoa]|uniref:uncharacterized protein LOC110734146 n=1 Tax=Chenopodium quinoa TaxID=63459 RepID=UPI000B77B8CB|nr:uncharacterized protein LOC110734146 [Chenopodium quinoa]